MPAIFYFQHIVTGEEIDGQGHVNNLEYVKWMQRAAVEHSTAQGWSPERYRPIGAGWVVRSHHIEYLQPAFAGDAIVVQTSVADFKKIQSLRKYKIFRPDDNTVLTVAETNWVFVGAERRGPRRIPQELRDSFIVVPEHPGTKAKDGT